MAANEIIIEMMFVKSILNHQNHGDREYKSYILYFTNVNL